MSGVLNKPFRKTPRHEKGGERYLNTDAPITEGQLSGFRTPEAF